MNYIATSVIHGKHIVSSRHHSLGNAVVEAKEASLSWRGAEYVYIQRSGSKSVMAAYKKGEPVSTELAEMMIS